MKVFFLYFLTFSLWIFSFLCNADSTVKGDYKTQADDHAPIFVMGDHNHKAGEWMFSLRYSQRAMKDNFKGSEEISAEEIFKSNYKMAPTDMFMSMYMGGMMYGLSDRLTFMLMASFISKRMSMLHSPERKSAENKEKIHTKSHAMKTAAHRHYESDKKQMFRHNMFSQGFGDIKLSGLFTLYESLPDLVSSRPRHKFLLESGLSFPTGSITKGKNTRYPYPMQLGSGSIDPLVSLVYVFKMPRWSLGAQSRHISRFVNNKLDYKLGGEHTTAAWFAYNILQQISVSCRLEYKHWGNIKGEDKKLDKRNSPASRTDLRAGKSFTGSVGLNLYQTRGPFSGHRLGLEFGMPLYQNLKGPQMGLNHYIMAGWQLAL